MIGASVRTEAAHASLDAKHAVPPRVLSIGDGATRAAAPVTPITPVAGGDQQAVGSTDVQPGASTATVTPRLPSRDDRSVARPTSPNLSGSVLGHATPRTPATQGATAPATNHSVSNRHPKKSLRGTP